MSKNINMKEKKSTVNSNENIDSEFYGEGRKRGKCKYPIFTFKQLLETLTQSQQVIW